MLCLVSTFVFAVSAFALTGNQIDQCYDCHGTQAVPGPADIRPNDLSYRNISTGAFMGNHRTHMPTATTLANVCTPCHGAAPTAMDHRDGVIKIRQHINSTASVRGTYFKGIFFNQTSAPNLNTAYCSNVNCHFRTQTPLWGSAALSGGQTVANCAVCHQSTGMASGNHAKHITALGSTVTACSTCHPNNTTFTHATSAKTGGSITVTFAGAPKGTGTYTGTGTHKNYPNYLDGTGTYNSCNNTYCHGTTGPAWNSAGPLACNSCHDAVPTGLALRHDKHYNSAVVPAVLAGGTDAHTATNYVYSCQTCHPTNQHAAGPASAVAPLQDAAVLGTKISAYVKGSAATTDAKSFNYTTNGTCTTVCHTKDGVTAGSAVVAQNWGTASTGTCGVCHNKAGDAAPTWSTPHTKHINTYGVTGLNTNITCASCHAGTATNNTTINGITGRNQHPNANRDLAMDTFAIGSVVSIAGAQGAQTCSNTYCHSNGTVAAGTHTAISWSGVTTCASCHASSPATGAHTKHIALSGVTCAYCHNATTTNGTTIAATGYPNHVNKNVTINFNASAAAAGGTYNGVAAGGASVYQKAPGIAAGACGTTLCHGSNSGTWSVANADATCVKCHGVVGTTPAAYTANINTAAPGYNATGVNTAGVTGTVTGSVSNDAKVGAHDAHLRSLGGYKPGGVVCADCHAVTAITSAGHMNGASTMTWSNLAKNIGTTPYAADKGALVPGYTAPTCSTNYCHGGAFAAGVQGTGVSVSWVNGTYLNNPAATKNAADCNQCHMSPPTASVKFAHTAMTIATDCTPCHGHNGNGPTHIDGQLVGAGDCNSCHGYQAGSWAAAPSINAEGKGAHEAHIAYLTNKRFLPTVITLDPTTDQYAGATTAWTNVCGVCHGNTATNHQNGTVNFSINTAYFFGTAGSATYNGAPGVSSAVTAKTCSNISCHYLLTPIWSTY